MSVVGIIAEYNPLHNGHVYHLKQAIEKAEASFVIVVMSGNFVQRGEPACTDKYTRAQWALQAGADIVLELPCVFANSSAQSFAEGAVRLLNATGVVTDLAFGCEQASLSVLNQLLEVIVNEPPEYKACLKLHMKSGKSYPRARYDALQELGAPGSMLQELVKPNNILAIEYLRSLKRLKSSIRPLPIERIGSDYNDAYLTGEFSSATAIRNAVKSGDSQVTDALPLFVSGAMKFDEQFPVTSNDVGAMMLFKIRNMSLEEIRELPDVSEGFEQTLSAAAKTAVSAESFFESVKSKRYTLARCKRIGMSALLGLTKELQSEMVEDRNLYFKVLGLKKDARSLLSAIASISKVPIIMRNSDIFKCSETGRASLDIDALSTDILAYALQKEMHRDNETAVLI